MSEAEPQPAAPHVKVRWYQYRLRTLLMLITVVAVLLGWFMPRYRLAERQRQVMSAVGGCGGTVFYDDGNYERYFLSILPPLWYEAICGPRQRIVAVDVGNGKYLAEEDIAAIRYLGLERVFYNADTIDASTLQGLQHALPQSRFQADRH